MESNRYNVILNYDPQNREIHEKIVACFLRLDPAATERLESTGFTGRLVVKRNADSATAKRLKRLITSCGAQCHIQQAKTQNPRAGEPVPENGNPVPDTRRDTDLFLTSCPNCGFAQPPDNECRSCGIIFSKARSFREKTPVRTATIEKESPGQAPFAQFLERIRQSVRPIMVLIEKIQHPLNMEKLTRWTQRVLDSVLRCGIVFCIALILQIGLLCLGKMLWFLYTSTTVGQYYIKFMPEEAEILQRIVNADPLQLGLETSLTAMFAGLIIGCTAQVLHLIRYLYDSRGIVGKLVLWYVPAMVATAWLISQQHPYPNLETAVTLAAMPILCTLSSCLYFARIVLPEMGEAGKLITIIKNNREKTWGHTLKKIQVWFESTKKVH